MTRRRLLLATLILLIGIGLTGLVLHFGSSGPGVTRANFDRIADGDSRARVDGLLGGPPRNESANMSWSMLGNGVTRIGHTREVWGGDDGAAVLVFDENGRVVHRDWVDSTETFLDRLRHRLFRLRL